MKTIAFTILFLFVHISNHAQVVPSFNSLRYDESYDYLKNDTNADWYKKAKFTALSKNKLTYVSFGGDVRYQYFNIKNENWGEVPADNDGFLFSRFLFHADLHLGKHFRTFLQLQSSLTNGKLTTSPVDEDPLELHQAFFDIDLTPDKKNKFLFRAGRQEFSYGSQRLVATREGPNNRQSFDALKIIFLSGNYKWDIFYSHPVKTKKDLFNDGFNKDNQFWGTYFVRNKLSFLQNIDLYYLGINKAKTVFDDGKGKEIRHSVGSRIWSSESKLKYDIEGVYQFGKFEAKNISAWTLSFNTGYKFNTIKFKPELGLKTELISGDANYGDNKLQTFNPLFPRGAYFGLASLVGPSNLFDIHPSLLFELINTFYLNIDYDIFWRYSSRDGIYAPNVTLIYSGKDNPYKFIGRQLSGELIYTPNNYLYFRAEFTWFKAGDFLKAAGAGKDILFKGLTAQLKF